VTVTINAEDPRTIRAIELAAEADRWLSGRNREGEDVFGVPSQSEPGRYYIVTRRSCDCPAFRHGEPAADGETLCKHILAVRLHAELVRAQQRLPRPRERGHLTLVPKPQT
jgi:SWIM zinc finger